MTYSRMNARRTVREWVKTNDVFYYRTRGRQDKIVHPGLQLINPARLFFYPLGMRVNT